MLGSASEDLAVGVPRLPLASRWRLLPLVVGSATLAAVFLLGNDAQQPLGFPLDDAWIHMVYGRSLAHQGLLAYNPGISATGATSPLWALFLGLVHLTVGSLGVPAVVLGVFALGCIAFLLSLVWVTDGVFRQTGEALPAVTAGLLLALSAPYAAASFSGMEVTLCGFLLLGGASALHRRHFGRTGLWLALSCLARPEAAVVLLVALLVACWRADSLRQRFDQAARMGLPALLMGSAVLLYDWVVSRHLLTATYYFKQESSLTALPERLWVAVSEIFCLQVPPLLGWIGLLALLGLLPWRRPRVSALPLLLGTVFLLGNLLMIAPVDPQSFYHARYVLPALPLLIVALGLGCSGLSRILPSRWARWPAGVLLAVGVLGCAATLPRVSTRLHNDTRNINEVQRAMGLWLARSTPVGCWVATSDAGAVRFFSDRPTIDVLGLNTPDLYWSGSFGEAHPVCAIAILPAWFELLGPAGRLRVQAAFRTKNYTVTSRPRMARQIILTNPSTKLLRADFRRGSRHFSVWLRPWQPQPAAGK